MTKAIIPRIQLPGVSEESINKLRYRIINRNRNLYSQWSVIGEIKRERDETDFSDNPDAYAVDNSIAKRVDVSWYTPDINQEFDIYIRYKLYNFSPSLGVFYAYDDLQYLGRKNVNSITINELPLSNRISIYSLSNYSVQTMVKLPEYPRTYSVPVEILQFERVGGDYIYYLSKNANFVAGDYVNINLNNKTSPSLEDNSEFAGIKLVKSVNAKSFTVQSSGSDISIRNSVNIDPSTPNNAQKINGLVQFVTDDILFT